MESLTPSTTPVVSSKPPLIIIPEMRAASILGTYMGLSQDECTVNSVDCLSAALHTLLPFCSSSHKPQRGMTDLRTMIQQC